MKINVYCVHLLFMGVFLLKSKMKGFLWLITLYCDIITLKQGDEKKQPLGQPNLLGSYAFFGKEY